MFRLDGKVALVTGGSRGIGRAISLMLAKAGATVVVAYRGDEESALATISAIEASGGKAEAVRLDVADAEAVDAAISDMVKRHGKLDVLVNNAGIARDQLLIRVKPVEVRDTFATNVDGTLWCSKSAIRHMMRARTGRVINLTSVVGESGNIGQSVYAASKAAIIGITKSLAREYAGRAITVNAVAPGFIDTDMTKDLPAEAKTAMLSTTPLARAGQADEVAAAVLYLASDEASYVTGQVLRVNGGMYM